MHPYYVTEMLMKERTRERQETAAAWRRSRTLREPLPHRDPQPRRSWRTRTV